MGRGRGKKEGGWLNSEPPQKNDSMSHTTFDSLSIGSSPSGTASSSPSKSSPNAARKLNTTTAYYSSLDFLYTRLEDGIIPLSSYLTVMKDEWDHAAGMAVEYSWANYNWDKKSFDILREVKEKIYLPNHHDLTILKHLLFHIHEILLLFVLDGEIRRWVREGLVSHFRAVIDFYNVEDDHHDNRVLMALQHAQQITWGPNPKHKSILSEIAECREEAAYPEFAKLIEDVRAKRIALVEWVDPLPLFFKENAEQINSLSSSLSSSEGEVEQINPPTVIL